MKHKNYITKTPSRNTKEELSQNLTQKDLATRVNLPVIVINEIESG